MQSAPAGSEMIAANINVMWIVQDFASDKNSFLINICKECIYSKHKKTPSDGVF